jgi:hypothetical protein
MNPSSIVAFVLVGASLIGGCTNAVGGQGATERTNTSVQSLTLAECASQRDACLANDPLLGFLLCPLQYDQCAASASNGLPAQVNSAISDTAACVSADRQCVNAATTPAQVASCATTQAQCVASVVQDHLPTVVSGTATCVDDAIKCINAAEQVSDLTTCANSLESCAVTQAQTVLPSDVGKAIGSVSSCQTTLNSCISAASTPAAVTACSQTDATCVAKAVGVTLPDVSISGVVTCAQTAANCVLDATSVQNVTTCANSLNSCTAEAVGAVGAPPPMTCAQKWTACLAQNPLNFLQCDSQLLTCQ